MAGGIPGIVPRWEWRTFGDHFPAAEAAFSAMESTGIQETDETYLLAGARNGVKVRDDLMDVKILREISSEGLERWEPVLKASFPMSADDVSTVLKALDTAPAQSTREAWTLDEFLADFGGEGKDLRPVNVHKRRVRYRINGCTSEVTDVTADGRNDKDDCDRARGWRGRAAGRPPGGPERVRQHQLSPRPAGDGGGPAGPLRGHRRRHQFGQVPRRRAAAGRAMAAHRRSGRDHPPRRRAGAGRRDHSGGAGAHDGGHPRDG